LASFFAFTFDNRNDFTSDPPAKREETAGGSEANL